MNFNSLLSILLLGGMFIIFPGWGRGDEVYTLWSLMGIGALSLFLPPSRTVRLAWPMGFFLVGLFCTVLKYTDIRENVLENLFIGTIGLKVIADRIRIDVRDIGKFLLGYCLLASVVLALQVTGKDPLYMHYAAEISGTSGYPWVMGCTAALAVPFLLTVHPLATLAALPLLWYSHSSSSLLASFICLYIYAIEKYPKYLKLFGWASVAGLICALVLERGIEPHRFHVWMNCFRFYEGGLLGMGLGSWAHQGFVHLNGNDYYHWWTAHNDFLQTLWELGPLGLTALTIFVLQLLTETKSLHVRTALITLAVLTNFHPIFHHGKLAFLGIVILALCLAEGHINQTEVDDGQRA